MQSTEANHYTVLGLDRRCTDAQIKTAYRVLARQHHPDLNPGSSESVARTQALNAAYEVLSDPERRTAFDAELAAKQSAPSKRGGRGARDVAQEVNLRFEDFLRGTTLEVRVKDPANPEGPETYELVVPPGTAPGARFRLPRTGVFAGGWVRVRVRALPGFRFKARGSDLRCDLTLKPQRAEQGGTEMVPGVTGAMVRVEIPRGVGRGEILRVAGEGLPRPRGGRGDLLVRIKYRVEVKVTRRAGR